MRPAEQTKPTMKTFSVYVPEWVLLGGVRIAKEIGKSKNALFSGFLQFAVELFPHLDPMRKAVQEYADSVGVSYAEAVALLVKRGLKAGK